MINLALILTVLTLFSGVIVAIDKMVWKTAEDDSRDSQPGALRTLVEYSRSFFPVLLFVLVIRSFIFEPFRIPSGSMMPTLLKGDFIFVKKFSYGLRLPVTESKVIETGEPRRGDVVVFRLPSDPSVNYIKRVIGLPGDEIVYERQRLTINGETMDLKQAGSASYSAPVFVEDLDGRIHDILVTNPQFSTRDGTYRVPDGHYFVMGDNRDRSRDSRFIGAIHEKFLVGEASRIWMHFVPWNMPEWRRIGQKIQ
ncbi:MAG: signal peptidase I [Woeseiaceae bacterium]